MEYVIVGFTAVIASGLTFFEKSDNALNSIIGFNNVNFYALGLISGIN